MAAKSGGGARAGITRKKNQEMAARLRGVTRETGRCPVCYVIAKNGTHPGPLCFRKS